MIQRLVLQTCLWIGIVLSTIPSIFAQSYYSQSEIGLVRYFVSGPGKGMGRAGLAVADPLSINFINPAALTNLKMTLISGNFLHSSSSLKSKATNAEISYTNVDGVQFHIPLKSSRVSTALGLMPLSTIEYSFAGDSSINGSNYHQVVSGDGGVNTAFVSLAVRPFDRLSIGVTGLYYFGSLRKLWRVVFTDQQDFLNTQDEISETFTAGNIRIGMQLKILPGWNVAAVVSPAVKLDVNKTVILQSIKKFSDFTDRNIELPLSYGLGTAFYLGRKLLIGTDYYVEQWSNSSARGYVNDSKQFSFGLEYSGRGSSFNSSYLSRMMFRAGFYYRDLGLEEPVGENVTELFGSIGIGLPIKWSAARLDLALEAGRRGALPDNPVKESIVRFSLTVTAGERWFYRGGPR